MKRCKRRMWLPNLVTLARIPLALGLLLLPPVGIWYLLVYALCGLTDIMDGYLARRLHAASSLGAALDSAAAFLLLAVCLFTLWPVVRPGIEWLVWAACIALIRLGAALTAWLRWRKFGFLHTWLNKITGFVLFLYPFTLAFPIRIPNILLPACLIASLSAGEELLMQFMVKNWDPERRGLFAKENRHA